MTNYKKMYKLMNQGVSDALHIMSSSNHRENEKEWVSFLLEQAQICSNYIYRTTVDDTYILED